MMSSLQEAVGGSLRNDIIIRKTVAAHLEFQISLIGCSLPPRTKTLTLFPRRIDPRPTSSAFPQRKPTAEAKGGILPDQHGEPSLSRGLAAGGQSSRRTRRRRF